MKDSECVAFLQWALPRLRLRWAGFRRVRGQVCKRIDRRLGELGLANASAYRAYLEAHRAEWSVLDGLCFISISRFYRDKAVFQFLEGEVLARLAQIAVASGESAVRCWSIGCASGEEPYTLAILWKVGMASRFPALGLHILATDADARALERAREGRYPASSLKDLPKDVLAEACIPMAGGFCVKEEYRRLVSFLRQDVREAAPESPFHLILCRNLAFTYFAEGLPREVLERIRGKLVPGGALVTGSRESLPTGASGFEPWSQTLRVYRKVVAR
jgi:chemotaxis protein methyltransferase CheR